MYLPVISSLIFLFGIFSANTLLALFITTKRHRIALYFTSLYTSILILQEKNKAGDVLGDSEKTATDKKRERRRKKKVKRLKIQEREKRKKLKEAASEGKITKKSKAQVEETLKKLAKGGKAKVLTVSVCLVLSVKFGSGVLSEKADFIQILFSVKYSEKENNPYFLLPFLF